MAITLPLMFLKEQISGEVPQCWKYCFHVSESPYNTAMFGTYENLVTSAIASCQKNGIVTNTQVK